MKLKYYLKHFHYLKTMILKKFEKNDYIQLKSYRSIVFFNTFEKKFEKIIVIKINYLIKKY